MKFPKMNAIFFHWINVKQRVGDDNSYYGVLPEECDREFLIRFIKSFQPKFSDDDAISFDDLILKSKSLLIHAEIEYPLNAPYHGKIWWKFRDLSEPYIDFEFDFLHELDCDEIRGSLECEREGEPNTDEDDDENVDSDEFESEKPSASDVLDKLYDDIRDVLKKIEHFKCENKKHERKFLKMLPAIFQKQPFIERWLVYSGRMQGNPDRAQIIKDLYGRPGGPILEFRERLSNALWRLNHQRRFHDNLHSPW